MRIIKYYQAWYHCGNIRDHVVLLYDLSNKLGKWKFTNYIAIYIIVFEVNKHFLDYITVYKLIPRISIIMKNSCLKIPQLIYLGTPKRCLKFFIILPQYSFFYRDMSICFSLENISSSLNYDFMRKSYIYKFYCYVFFIFIIIDFPNCSANSTSNLLLKLESVIDNVVNYYHFVLFIFQIKY